MVWIVHMLMKTIQIKWVEGKDATYRNKTIYIIEGQKGWWCQSSDLPIMHVFLNMHHTPFEKFPIHNKKQVKFAMYKIY